MSQYESPCFTATTFARSGIVATDGTMDPECVALCEALSRLPGVEVIAACSGHGAQPVRVWFTVDRLKTLAQLVVSWKYWLTYGGWQCLVQASCSCCPVRFELVSHSDGELAAKEATALWALLMYELEASGHAA